MGTFSSVADVRAVAEGITPESKPNPVVEGYIERADESIISSLSTGFDTEVLYGWQDDSESPDILRKASSYLAAAEILIAVLDSNDDEGHNLRRSYRKIANDIIKDLLSRKIGIVDKDKKRWVANVYNSEPTTTNDRKFDRKTFKI